MRRRCARRAATRETQSAPSDAAFAFLQAYVITQPITILLMLHDAIGQEHGPCDGAPRIVSLVPSLTELVCELGLTQHLVGRSGFCVHPRQALRQVPKVGGTKDVAVDKVRALGPTHVIVNIDENRRETVSALLQFVPHVIVTHPLRPADNVELFRLFGTVFRCEGRAEFLSRRFADAIACLESAASRHPREHVLYIIWKGPWMTVSRDTYISAMLATAGWDTLPAEAPARYPEFAPGAPWLSKVDRVLLPSEPYRFRDRHVEEVSALLPLRRAPVQLIDGTMTSWYGSRAIAGLRYLERLREAGGR